jgi:uncharacterized protein (TIGR02996 family)
MHFTSYPVFEQFMAVLRESPDDMTARLVFADWIEEQGYPEEAQKVREKNSPVVDLRLMMPYLIDSFKKLAEAMVPMLEVMTAASLRAAAFVPQLRQLTQQARPTLRARPSSMAELPRSSPRLSRKPAWPAPRPVPSRFAARHCLR